MKFTEQETLDAKKEAQRLLQLVIDHNRECEEECALNCSRGSGCPACPKNYMVDASPISIMEEDSKQHLATGVSEKPAYYPDSWVILKVKENGLYKVLGGWSGGYRYGDSWRMNSGIVRVEECKNYWLMHGHSGSIYFCDKRSYGLRMSTTGIYMKLEDRVEMMPADTDWGDLLHVEGMPDGSL